MESNELFLAKNERQSLSRSSRITNFIFGIILIISVLVVYHFHEIFWLMVGLFFIVYGLVGLEFFKTCYSVNLTRTMLEIVKSHRQDIRIDLSLVKYISLRNNELQVHYSDYVKTYDLQWLLSDDYHDLKAKLDEIVF